MPEQKSSIWQKISKVGIMLIFASAFVLFFLYGKIIPENLADAPVTLFIFVFLSLVMLVANMAYFAWQILLVHQYRGYPDPGDDKLPTIGVIVPAFNEGKQVEKTLIHLLRSDYPRNKLEIITVNDGSRDDTWNWIYAAVEKAGQRIIALDLPKNAGKRNAICKGLLVSSAEIIVTLDSDTLVEPRSLREIAAPFVAEKKIGGVAGSVRVSNTKDGIIPRMLDVSFVFGFEFLKSAQSMLHTVLCQPGAFSAFRRSALLPYINEWVNETFFGKPAIIAEDRALTNILLREGWQVVFQKNAIGYSEMPTSYIALSKMMIRWTRGNFRENFMLFKYAFRKIDVNDPDLTAMQINLVVQTFWQISPIVMAFFIVWSIFNGSFAFITGIIISIIFWSTLPAFIYAKQYSHTESLWSYVYGAFSFITMAWVAPYSVLTVHKSGWMTRQTPEKKGDKKDGSL